MHSHYAPQLATSGETKGNRPCHKCSYCWYICASRHIIFPNGRMYKPKFLATCQSIGVVYIMICDCDAFYVGKTKQPFFHRIRDHVSLVLKIRWKSPYATIWAATITSMIPKCIFLPLNMSPEMREGVTMIQFYYNVRYSGPLIYVLSGILAWMML